MAFEQIMNLGQIHDTNGGQRGSFQSRQRDTGGGSFPPSQQRLGQMMNLELST